MARSLDSEVFVSDGHSIDDDMMDRLAGWLASWAEWQSLSASQCAALRFDVFEVPLSPPLTSVPLHAGPFAEVSVLV